VQVPSEACHYGAGWREVLCGYCTVAYKPSHSMVGKKTESRYEPEPCCPTCYLIELVCAHSSLSAIGVFYSIMFFVPNQSQSNVCLIT